MERSGATGSCAGCTSCKAKITTLNYDRGVVDLRRLRYFLAVAGERNFTRAAERLHVAQPALSRQVRLLERELGVELVRRTTHTFELTEAGDFLRERGAGLLESADALSRAMRAYGSGEQGHVVVAYGASASYDTAPRLLRAVTERLPGLEIKTRVMAVDEIVAALGDGSIDVGVVRCPPEVAGVQSQLLRLEPQGVLVRSDHRWARRRCVRLVDLSDEPVLLHPREANPGHYDAIVALLSQAAVEPRLELRDLSFDIAQTPVREGDTVAIVGESTVVGLSAGLVWLPLSPPATIEVRLLARRLDRSPAVERLLEAAPDIADEFGWRDAPRA